MKNGPYELIVPPSEYPGKRYRGRYAYEHRVEFWKRHGRLPEEGNVVHHRNEKKRDNDWKNLQEKTVGEHNADHNTIAPVSVKCGWCKATFFLKPCVYRDRLRKNKSGLLFCCRSHQVSAQQRAFISGDKKILGVRIPSRVFRALLAKRERGRLQNVYESARH